MTINPALEPFLARWQAEWASLPAGAGPAERRAHFETVARNMRLPDPDGVAAEREEWVDSPAGPVRVRIFRHVAGGPRQPCLIYMHGGAFMQGSPETHWDITARIAAWNRQTVISVDYALAPEHPFPAALDQVNGVIRWARAQAGALGIDPARIAVGGDSAGGNLAAAAALDLRGEVPLIAQLLIYPACDFDRSRPSYRENAEGPIVRVADMERVNAMYCPDPADLRNPRAAPLLAESHAGLPPTYIAVAEHDPLRDSGVAYAEALRAAGVPVVLDPGQGLIHGYLRAMGYCPEAEARLRAMAGWLAGRNA
ncbi:MAG: alpha/beta hydrolase [Paracoccaceae bacterium]|nr:MAG: alpha/beta hydrolase [Paracoccaceae bacterium]